MTDITVVLAPVILALGGALLLLVDLLIARDNKRVTAWLAAGIVFLAFLGAMSQWGRVASGFDGMVKTDDYAVFFDCLLTVIGIATIILSLRYNEAGGIMRGEFYPLILFSLSGMCLLGHAMNLLIVFLGIELLSIPLYVLCGFARSNVESEESSLKYFLLGAFASGFLVYGIALMYGATGTTDLVTLSKSATVGPMLLAGVAFVLVGLGFKVAAAPFHMWTPDVYEGAPTIVTAFMVMATKAAAFAVLARVAVFGLAPVAATIQPAIAVLAALTMIVGNVTALAQLNLKRMLAYSSVAQAGYALVGVAANTTAGMAGVLFFVASYAVTACAAFAVMTLVAAESKSEDQSIAAYTGLFRSRPGLALVMSVAMFSFIGIPPTAGFAGKYFVFQSAIDVGMIWLALLGVVMSVVSATYYLRVVVVMFSAKPDEAEDATPAHARSGLHGLTTAVAAVAIVVIGVLPTPLLALVNQGALSATAK